MKSKMFNTLPPEVNRQIGSFLDYESRINFSRVLPTKDDKFVRKLESDEHNRRVKFTQIYNLVVKITGSISPRKRAIMMARLFRYMALTKDTCILDIENTAVRQVIIDKAIKYSNMNNESFHLIHHKVSKSLVRAATLLLDRVESHKPKKLFVTAGRLVEII